MYLQECTSFETANGFESVQENEVDLIPEDRSGLSQIDKSEHDSEKKLEQKSIQQDVQDRSKSDHEGKYEFVKGKSAFGYMSQQLYTLLGELLSPGDLFIGLLPFRYGNDDVVLIVISRNDN